jgi:hypothetical protein
LVDGEKPLSALRDSRSKPIVQAPGNTGISFVPDHDGTERLSPPENGVERTRTRVIRDHDTHSLCSDRADEALDIQR